MASSPISRHETLAFTLIPGLNPISKNDLYCALLSERDRGETISEFLTRKSLAVNWEALMARASEIIDHCVKSGIQLLYRGEEEFPIRLAEDDAPLLLYLKGDSKFLNKAAVSIVGTRQATNYGRAHCINMAGWLARSGFVVVSGLAYGIDSFAHQAALDVGGVTIGILANGLDAVYPKGNRFLADQILKSGCLLSEYPPAIRPAKYTFPMRNRLIAAISEVTLVVESAKRGGSMITAELAYGYNRQVMAIPGRLNDSYSEGCNQLIKRKIADLVTQPEDVLTHYPGLKEAMPQLPASESKLLHIIGSLGTPGLDDLLSETGLSLAELSVQLVDLQLDGRIEELPGKLYCVKAV